MFGNRGIYNDGWYANTRPIVDAWALFSVPPQDVMNSYTWELYDLTKDWTQDHDLADKMPDKLRDMQELFIAEASKYQVFPLDNALATRMVTPRPSVVAGRPYAPRIRAIQVATSRATGRSMTNFGFAASASSRTGMSSYRCTPITRSRARSCCARASRRS